MRKINILFFLAIFTISLNFSGCQRKLEQKLGDTSPFFSQKDTLNIEIQEITGSILGKEKNSLNANLYFSFLDSTKTQIEITLENGNIGLFYAYLSQSDCDAVNQNKKLNLEDFLADSSTKAQKLFEFQVTDNKFPQSFSKVLDSTNRYFSYSEILNKSVFLFKIQNPKDSIIRKNDLLQSCGKLETKKQTK